MEIWGWVILAAVNIPVYILVGRVFFKNWGEFGEALVFWVKPDIISAFQGEFWDDLWAELKLGMFITVCGAMVWGEASYVVIPYVVPMFP